MLQEPLSVITCLGRNLREPDRRFYSFNLAEKRTNAADLVVPPVLEKTRRLGCDLPLVGVRDPPPAVDLLADTVNDGGVVVTLFLCREALALIKQECGLLGGSLALSRLRNRGDELRPPAGLQNSLGGLPRIVEFPMLGRVFVGGVENRTFEKSIRHLDISLLVSARKPWRHSAGHRCRVAC